MGGDKWFWYLFGGIFFLIGASFVLGSIGLPSLLDPSTFNADGPPLWIFTLAGLPFAGIGGAIIYFARKRAAHDRHILEAGFAQTAVVTDIRRSFLEINRQPRYYVHYRYDYGGRSLDGRSRMLTGSQAAAFKPGETVRIKLDLANPSDSLFLGEA
jgi:Protein of unknown function (DUF3592)